MDVFDVGDMVTLKSGSDPMTVVEVFDDGLLGVAFAADYTTVDFAKLPVEAVEPFDLVIEYEDYDEDETEDETEEETTKPYVVFKFEM